MTESSTPFGPIFTYDAASDSFPVNDTTGAFLNASISSVNGDGTSIATELLGVSILDTSLETVANVGNFTGGLIFDPHRERLYVVDAIDDDVVALDTDGYAELFRLNIGQNATSSSAHGNGEMSISPDASKLFLSTGSGVRMFDLGPVLPIALDVQPDRVPFPAPPIQVALSGKFFDLATNTQVFFGDVEATDVQVVDGVTVLATTPASLPGVVDVRLTSSAGQTILPDAFAYTPAIQVSGNLTPGGEARIEYLVEPGDGLIAIYGLPPEVAVATPPFAGSLCVAAPFLLFEAPSWFLDVFEIEVPIAASPSLSGVTILLQALVGPDLAGGVGAWSNCAEFEIQ